MEHGYMSHARENGSGHWKGWWRINFTSVGGILGMVVAALAIFGAVWAANKIVVVSVLDAHIRTVSKEESARMTKDIVIAVLKEEFERRDIIEKERNVAIQKQIDDANTQIKYNRDEREKFQRMLAKSDESTAIEIRELRISIDKLYALLVEHMGKNADIRGGK